MDPMPELVARCGLYCGACRSYLKGRCPGCAAHAKATWCKVRTCCGEKSLPSCAGCADHPDPMACKKFNNPMAKLFGFLFRSDRAACIDQIKRIGLEEHARSMASLGAQTLKRRKR
jgi:hypothetical protein